MEISTNDLQELTNFNNFQEAEEDFLSEERCKRISTSRLTNIQKSSFNNNGHRTFSNLLPRNGHSSGGEKGSAESLIEHHQKHLRQKADDSITEKLNAISGYSRSLPNLSTPGKRRRSFSTLLQRDDNSTTGSPPLT